MGANYENRDRKYASKKSRMPKHGRSVFTIQAQQVKRAEQIKAEKDTSQNNR